ncbi:hypothetical protein M3J09_006896 [Ascochyta lentis]
MTAVERAATHASASLFPPFAPSSQRFVNCDDRLSRHDPLSTRACAAFLNKPNTSQQPCHNRTILDPTQHGLDGDSPCGSSPSRIFTIETSPAANEKAVTSSMHGTMTTIATHQSDARSGRRRLKSMEPFTNRATWHMLGRGWPSHCQPI